jgi:hypothetical protein
MQQHYSTVNGAEVRDGLAKVISLAGFRQAQTFSRSGVAWPLIDRATKSWTYAARQRS